MKAILKNYRQSPRKVSLVTGLIKGKRVSEAFIHLDNLPKRASLSVKKLLASAVANAKQAGISEDNLVVDNIIIEKGIVLKRHMPRARGSASRINKRTSHIKLLLKEVTDGTKKEIKNDDKAKISEKKAGDDKKEVKKTVKKSVKTKVTKQKSE